MQPEKLNEGTVSTHVKVAVMPAVKLHQRKWCPCNSHVKRIVRDDIKSTKGNIWETDSSLQIYKFSKA